MDTNFNVIVMSCTLTGTANVTGVASVASVYSNGSNARDK